MIRARRLRELKLASPPGPGRAAHLAAASGLVVAGNHLYVVADDELHLGRFDAAGDRPGELVRLFPGELPDGRKARKRRKPDLEVITRLPAFARFPAGALLALGSGSRPGRRRGALIALDSAGAVAGAPLPLDLTGLYEILARHFPALNIEGGAVLGDELVLLQRANKKHRVNALVRVSLGPLLASIAGNASDGDGGVLRVQPVEIGEVNGIPLSFTDCAALPDGRLVFTAVGEDTDDSYADGACAGAAVGVLALDGTLERIEPLAPTRKVEGVHARLDVRAVELLLVTDADDADVPAELLAAELA